MTRAEITLEQLQASFNLPIVEAARKFDMCTTRLKKICRGHGIKRWPHRQIQSALRGAGVDLLTTHDAMGVQERSQLHMSLLASKTRVRSRKQENSGALPPYREGTKNVGQPDVMGNMLAGSVPSMWPAQVGDPEALNQLLLMQALLNRRETLANQSAVGLMNAQVTGSSPSISLHERCAASKEHSQASATSALLPAAAQQLLQAQMQMTLNALTASQQGAATTQEGQHFGSQMTSIDPPPKPESTGIGESNSTDKKISKVGQDELHDMAMQCLLPTQNQLSGSHVSTAQNSVSTSHSGRHIKVEGGDPGADAHQDTESWLGGDGMDMDLDLDFYTQNVGSTGSNNSSGVPAAAVEGTEAGAAAAAVYPSSSMTNLFQQMLQMKPGTSSATFPFPVQPSNNLLIQQQMLLQQQIQGMVTNQPHMQQDQHHPLHQPHHLRKQTSTASSATIPQKVQQNLQSDEKKEDKLKEFLHADNTIKHEHGLKDEDQERLCQLHRLHTQKQQQRQRTSPGAVDQKKLSSSGVLLDSSLVKVQKRYDKKSPRAQGHKPQQLQHRVSQENDDVSAMIVQEEAGLSVLVIEDEPLIRMTAEAFLKHLGHKVVMATNYAEATAAFTKELQESEEGFQIIFTDLDLGGRNQPGGLDLARWVREEEDRQGKLVPTPIIAVTSSNLVEDISGLSGFMVKPYQIHLLSRAITESSRARIDPRRLMKRQQWLLAQKAIANSSCLSISRPLPCAMGSLDTLGVSLSHRAADWPASASLSQLASNYSQAMSSPKPILKQLTGSLLSSKIETTVPVSDVAVAASKKEQPSLEESRTSSPLEATSTTEDSPVSSPPTPTNVISVARAPSTDSNGSGSRSDGSLGVYEHEHEHELEMALECLLPSTPPHYDSNPVATSVSTSASPPTAISSSVPPKTNTSSSTSNATSTTANSTPSIMPLTGKGIKPIQGLSTHLGRGGPLSVLVIEDEPLIRMTAEAFLKHLGHKVTLAMDFCQAQKEITAKRSSDGQGFDIIFTDLDLGGRNQPGGLDLARWIRDEEDMQGKLSPTPIIAVTGSNLVGDVSGFSGFMVKPYQIDLLSQAIDRWCL